MLLRHEADFAAVFLRSAYSAARLLFMRGCVFIQKGFTVMKLQYLGTAAAEGVPGMFCECEVCRKSRKAGGKNIRTRSQSLIDDKILIDFPADTYWHAMAHGVPLPEIHTCLITHSHSDHLYPMDLEMRSHGTAPVIHDDKSVTFYACKSGYDMITEIIKKYELDGQKRVLCKEITAFEPFETEGYTVIPLEASHDVRTTPVIFIIEKDGKRILYANDTGMFCEKTWDYLKSYGKRFDLISLDCTMQVTGQYSGHLNYEECILTRDKLRGLGMADDKTVCILNHFSHNGGLTYDEMCALAEKDGFAVSYDGFTVEI